MNKKTLVLGASLKPERYSNIAINRLLRYNNEVKAFGLKEGEVNGITIDTKLKPYKAIDTVTLYLNAKRQKAYYNYVISLKPNRVIFNPGTENPEFYALLEQHHIAFEEACTLVLLGTGQY
ncbi:CoA-binding protein [Winogradskyella sp.]|nr:CoA-binding protein [Winogradskyella sp.]MDC1505497.1 CoA-binding protein [Winogradskyella sp.]